ncbi:flagellar assembly protein FliH [Candidatus Kryptobacter tengchongensis]|nr:flagellar assembly protein FliH [Candidatus Kryptobacter tengchongensis]
MKKTLFTKKVIKNQLWKERFLFEELKIDDLDFKNLSDADAKDESVVESLSDYAQNSAEKGNEVDVETIIAQVKDEYELKVREAYQRGFRDAERILREKMNNELNEHIALFEQLLKSFYNEVESFETKVEIFVVSLAIKIAEKIVKREIEKNDDFILNQVKEAIKRVIGIEKIKLRINPDDEKLIRESKPELLQMLGSASEVIIEADPGIERGGCIIESELGNVDARISTQFSLIENSLIEGIR